MENQEEHLNTSVTPKQMSEKVIQEVAKEDDKFADFPENQRTCSNRTYAYIYKYIWNQFYLLEDKSSG